MKTLYLTLSALLITNIAFSEENKVSVRSAVSGVTVYNSAAELHFAHMVDIRKGKNTIVFEGLTPFIQQNTINVTTTGEAVNIITVNERINFLSKEAENNQFTSLKTSIIKNERELGLVKTKKDILLSEKELLFKGEGIGGVSQGVSVNEIEKASSFFNRRYSELAMELYNLSLTEDSLIKVLSNLQKQQSEGSAPMEKYTSEITVVLNSSSSQNIKIKFKFLTSKAGWAPAYDFKYNGPQEPLGFVFRANVFNVTGVDWKDVNLKLSTATPLRGFNLPSLKDDSYDDKTVAASEPVEGIEYKVLNINNPITEYKIRHNYTIPSDAKPYLVDVDAYSISSGYYYLLIPRMDPFGFLMARIPDWNKYNLIPGLASIYNNGTYMGKTFLDTYSENDTLKLYLGKDKSIQSTRTEEVEENKMSIIGNYSVEKTYTSINISNHSQSSLDVEVLDQVPVIGDYQGTKLEVQNIESADYDEKEGLLKWNFNLASGESKQLEFNYTIKYPKEFRYRPKKKRFRTITCPSF